MKRIFITIFCLSISAVAVNAQNNPAAAPPAQPQTPATPQTDPDAGKFKFEEETHDFGTVPEGPQAEYDFEFKNVGKKPINITEAHGSCGCTVPKWPSEPILPKHKGVIHVTYNTSGRPGMINKDVYITSNAQQNPMKLHITGNVTPKPAAPATPPPPPPPPVQAPAK
jgi:Protein of unknown function (DUF1573)